MRSQKTSAYTDVIFQYRGNVKFWERTEKHLLYSNHFHNEKICNLLVYPEIFFEWKCGIAMVYSDTCSGSTAIYVNQTSQHVTTRFLECQIKDSLVGQRLVECWGTLHNPQWDILDANSGVEQLMTIDVINIRIC